MKIPFTVNPPPEIQTTQLRPTLGGSSRRIKNLSADGASPSTCYDGITITKKD